MMSRTASGQVAALPSWMILIGATSSIQDY